MTQNALDLLGAASGIRDRVLILHSIDDFSVLDEEALTFLAEQARDRVFAKGEVIFEEGSESESMYFIIEGQVSVARNNGPIVMKTGDRLGVLSILAGTPNRRIVADVETRTLEVPAAAFKIAFEENFTLVRNALRKMSMQLLRMRGPLPVETTCELGPAFDRPKGLAERLMELRGGAFASMNLDALVDIARSMVEIRVPAGHVFWEAGALGDGMLQIAHGCVRCTAKDGKHVDVGHNSTLGSMEFFSRTPHTFEARAETDVIAYRIDGEDILVLLEMHVRVGLELVRLNALRLLERA